MKRLRIYQVDAFSGRLFGGNPAAVVPLDTWLDAKTMQSIALENNLAETAFFAPEGSGFRLRWFTPEVEVKLCGHATLASAYVLFTILEPGRREVKFETLLFRQWKRLRSDCRFCVFESEADVRALAPDFGALRKLGLTVIATAPGLRSDCVVRFFAPSAGIDEDPGTGASGRREPWCRTRRAFRLGQHRAQPLDDEAGDRAALGGRTLPGLFGERVGEVQRGAHADKHTRHVCMYA